MAFSADIELSRSLSQGLAALSCFTAEHPQLELDELANKLGLSNASARLYVSTLVSLGYLEQDEDERCRIGTAAVNVGRAFLGGLPIRQRSLPLLKQLRDLTGHTVSLAMLDGTDIIYLSRVHSHRHGQYRADLHLRTGARRRLLHSSAGRVLLAHLPEAQRHAFSADLHFNCSGPSHLDAITELRSELDRIRLDGFATTDQQPVEGFRTIARAVHDHDDTALTAIELTVPADLYGPEQIVTQLGASLALTCKQLGKTEPGA